MRPRILNRITLARYNGKHQTWTFDDCWPMSRTARRIFKLVSLIFRFEGQQTDNLFAYDWVVSYKLNGIEQADRLKTCWFDINCWINILNGRASCWLMSVKFRNSLPNDLQKIGFTSKIDNFLSCLMKCDSQFSDRFGVWAKKSLSFSICDS